jgi:hypothetical protein
LEGSFYPIILQRPLIAEEADKINSFKSIVLDPSKSKSLKINFDFISSSAPFKRAQQAKTSYLSTILSFSFALKISNAYKDFSEPKINLKISSNSSFYN